MGKVPMDFGFQNLHTGALYIDRKETATAFSSKRSEVEQPVPHHGQIDVG